MTPVDSASVSGIVPVYNGEAFLAEAVETIRRQSLPPLEIIIVDDGSTDRTAQIASRLGDDIVYSYQPNGGSASARNKGLALARGGVTPF